VKSCKSTVRHHLLVAGVVGLLGGIAEAQPTSLDDVVILARSELRIRRNTRHAAGQIVVNDPQGVAIINPSFRTVPDLQPQIVADRITVLRTPTEGPQLFDVFVNTLEDPKGETVVLGTLTMPIGVGLPLFSFPSPVTVTPGTTDVKVTRLLSPVTLPPGDYRDIRLRASSVVYLEGGTYNIRNLRVGPRSQMLANSSATLNVADVVRFRARSSFGAVSGGLLNGRCVVLNAATARIAKFGIGSDVTAVVNAPAATLILGAAGSFRGNFTANRVIFGRGGVIDTLPPLSEACP
jgi:hypothetical protein